MSKLRFCCLLFVVRSEGRLSAPTLDRTSIQNTVGVYALLPRIQNHHPREFQVLKNHFANCSISLITSEEDYPLMLTLAIRDDRTEIIQLLLKVDGLNVWTDNCNEALIKALLHNPFYVQGGSSSSLQYMSSDSNYRSAVEEANLPILEHLTSFGPDISYLDENGGTLLHFAVQECNGPLVRVLLQNGARTEARTVEGLTPLHVAAMAKTPTSIIDLLVQHGANINATATGSKYEGVTPLHLSLIKDSSPEVVNSLLENGAQMDAECRHGSVLQLAIKSCPKSLARYLSHRPGLSAESKTEALRTVLKSSYPSRRITKVLLEYGFDLVPDDAKDGKLFFGAVVADSREIVEKLINWGASVHYRDEKNRTALHIAASGDWTSSKLMIGLLLDRGSDIHVKDERGNTPLYKAVVGQHVEVVKYLLEKGARVQDTPLILHEAVIQEYPEDLVKLLLENGADVNACNESGETAMSLASDDNLLKVMEVLSHYGVSIDPQDKIIKKVLLEKIYDGNLSIVMKLVEKGANIQGIMKKALIWAMGGANLSIARFLLKIDDPRARTFKNGEVLRQAVTSRVPDIIEDILECSYLNIRSIRASGVLNYIRENYHGDDRRNRILNKNSDESDSRDVVSSHISAVKAANLNLNQAGVPGLRSWLQKSAAFYSPEDCEPQVAAMRNTMVGESNLSFYDILNSSVPQVVRYLRDERIVKALKSDKYGDFPIYYGIISKRFRKASYRRLLMNQGIKALEFLSTRFRGLPLELKESIIDYLSNQNLRTLGNVRRSPVENGLQHTPSHEGVSFIA